MAVNRPSANLRTEEPAVALSACRAMTAAVKHPAPRTTTGDLAVVVRGSCIERADSHPLTRTPPPASSPQERGADLTADHLEAV